MNALANRRRQAFTLIELLVVIAIIAILIALLVPAVQKVRQAAQVTECRNNLKQIGIGFHTHHDQYKHFPSGGIYWGSDRSTRNASGAPADFKTQAWGWGYQILPFIDQAMLYNQPAANDNLVAQAIIPVYFCPSVRQVKTITGYGGYCNTRAYNDYAGNGGSWGTSGSYGGPSTGQNSLDGALTPSLSASGYTRRMSDITDGPANTIFVGEKYVSKNAQLGSFDCNNDQGYTDGWDNDMIVFAQGDRNWGLTAPSVPPKKFDNTSNSCGGWFGSMHPSGCQFLYGDGAVRGVAFDVAPINFLAMCTANANDVAQVDP
ncbi:MAG: DUF1559 domain-containing protein [Planctomycetes bacterium]|nr:DUF1559 domain-containing protein [Planctomycetota bacterium]